MPLEIPSELLNCGFPPAIPAKPKTGDDGITSSQMVEILWATAFDCNQKLQAIREINGK